MLKNIHIVVLIFGIFLTITNAVHANELQPKQAGDTSTPLGNNFNLFLRI